MKKTSSGFLKLVCQEEGDRFLLVYCLMDNHVHMVVPVDEEALATTMKLINASYAFYFDQKYNRIGVLKKSWPNCDLHELMKNKNTRNEIVLHIRKKTINSQNR